MHAFQEPHLSLDAPMRENYRPDLAFHGSDGSGLGGSDGALRMPPMTFEPLINMPDAVRQPRASDRRAERDWYFSREAVMVFSLRPVPHLPGQVGTDGGVARGGDRGHADAQLVGS